MCRITRLLPVVSSNKPVGSSHTSFPNTYCIMAGGTWAPARMGPALSSPVWGPQRQDHGEGLLAEVTSSVSMTVHFKQDHYRQTLAPKEISNGWI